MVLEEEQDASRRAAGAQVLTMGAGEQLDRVNGERTQYDLRAARAMKVDVGHGRCGTAPPGDRRTQGVRARPIDDLEARPGRGLAVEYGVKRLAHGAAKPDQLRSGRPPATPAAREPISEGVEPRGGAGLAREPVKGLATAAVERVVGARARAARCAPVRRRSLASPNGKSA
jgi:hypothetical protein